MQVRLLGAHNLETRETRHTCFLVDGVLGIDAGSLASALTGDEQRSLSAILVTHTHFDHIRDLPTLGLTALDDDRTMDVYGLNTTLDSVHRHVMDGEVYPDLTKSLNGGPPVYGFHPHDMGASFTALGYEIKPIEATHSVPAVGYLIRAPSGACMGYSGDTSGGLLPFFMDEARPEVLFVEMTFPNRLESRAKVSGHLTPGLLGRELRGALERGAAMPRIVAVHVGFGFREEIARELADVSAQIGIEVAPGHEDATFEVSPALGIGEPRGRA